MSSNPCLLSCLPHHTRIECDLRAHGSRPIQLPQLVIVRGLPGSGKSTIARKLIAASYAHFEADQYFMVEGQYRYQPSEIRLAHEWCQTQTRRALHEGRRVVVANTFTRLSELTPYLRMTRDVIVVHAFGAWDNLHGVPPEVVKRMADRWERFSPAVAAGLLADPPLGRNRAGSHATALRAELTAIDAAPDTRREAHATRPGSAR